MTAEIGILNKIGVALAADSAVTISNSSRKNQKIYNTANKLFSLSKKHPVGIMVYGNGAFMGVPWEVVIKEYREKLENTSYKSLREYADDFISFLSRDTRFHSERITNSIIMNVVIESLKQINEILKNQISIFIQSQNRQPNDSEVESIINSILTQNISTLGNEEKSTFHNENKSLINENLRYGLEEKYQTSILAEISSLFKIQLQNNTIVNFYKYLGIVISLNKFRTTSGIVIAGYGDDEIFPSLIERRIDGIYFNFLKYTECRMVRIDATNCTASITPFAQQEMIHSFVTGIEPSLDQAYTNIFENVLNSYLNGQNISTVSQDVPKVMKAIKEHINDYKKQKFISPLIDVVRLLPKEELASMAETLVNLTSFKRKVSMDAETVGGPIDVAFISKGDGFVWINRKHYFTPELNYNFFQNY